MLLFPVVGLVLVVGSSVALTDYFFSGAANEKYEFSVLQATHVAVRSTSISKPELINAGDKKELFILHEQCDKTHVLVLLNPVEEKTDRQIPEELYRPSAAAVELLAKLSASAKRTVVVEKLIHQQGEGNSTDSYLSSICSFKQSTTNSMQ